MRSRRSFLYLNVMLLILLGACAPKATPTAAPVTVAPTLVPINLAGPEMKVGATFLYADGSLLVAVPAGIFRMGNGGPGNRPENPEHPVNLSDFWIYRTEVTNQQYAYCVALGGCTPPVGPDNPGFSDYLHANDPVVGVDYSQATDYCTFVHARLPSEAEWEKTARGLVANIYPWGDAAPTCALLNFGTCIGKTTPVNTYPAGQSDYTAFDMEGNVLEWVADWYRADYYLEAPTDNPQGPESGQARSVRSSAFNSGGDQTPAFTRSFSSPQTHRDNLGFRCVVEDSAYFAPFCEFPPIYGTDEIGGAATGDQIQVNCPDLSIEQAASCNGSKPVTIVTFHGPPGADIRTHGACTQISPVQFSCTAAMDVRICAECKVTLNRAPKCPQGYTYDAGLMTCVGGGSPGQCLPGFTQGTPGTDTPAASNEGGQCCTFEPGTSPVSTTPISPGLTADLLRFPPYCPAGTWFRYGPSVNHPKGECIPVPVESPHCKIVKPYFKSCTPGADPDVGCPVQSCGQNYIWNPVTCTCDCDGC
jgi:formylglycine-generating enzyme required for sulfatase activity